MSGPRGLIIDEQLLSLLRLPGDCEVCGKWCRIREPHHVFGRGANSWKRIDLPMFLLSVGSTPHFECPCHSRITNGAIGLAQQLILLSNRDGNTPQKILNEHDRILREMGKGGR